MKKTLLILFVSITSLAAYAQNMREVWINMPDSIVPYLNRSLRTELADYVGMNMKSEVRNLIGDTTRISLLTDNYIKAKLSNASALEIKLLDASTIAVVKTWFSPEAESELELYDKEWKKLAFEDNLKPTIEKPDTMSIERFNELQQLGDIKLRTIQLNPTDNSVLADYSFLLLNKAEKDRLKAIIKQRKFKWDGFSFKES